MRARFLRRNRQPPRPALHVNRAKLRDAAEDEQDIADGAADQGSDDQAIRGAAVMAPTGRQLPIEALTEIREQRSSPAKGRPYRELKESSFCCRRRD